MQALRRWTTSTGHGASTASDMAFIRNPPMRPLSARPLTALEESPHTRRRAGGHVAG